jgi:signal peptidase
VLPSVLIWTTVGLCAWWLWPSRFGGDTTPLVVDGNSMKPTYSSGDLIIAHADDHYQPGEIIVFRIKPPGNHSPDHLIVHRLIAIAPDGRITTQGDNRAVADGFVVTTHDIVGRARLRIPDGGTILHLLSRWWILGAVAGAITTLSLWPAAPAEVDFADEVEEWCQASRRRSSTAAMTSASNAQPQNTAKPRHGESVVLSETTDISA